MLPEIVNGIFLVSVSLFSALTAILFFAWKDTRSSKQNGSDNLSSVSDRAVFLFAGTRILDASPKALAFLGTPIDPEVCWAKLVQKLETICPGVAGQLAAVVDEGTPFEFTGADQTRILAKSQMGKCRIELFDNTELSGAIVQTELRTLRQSTTLSPTLSWRQTIDGQISWSNASYQAMVARVHPELAPDARASAPLFSTQLSAEPLQRSALNIVDANKPLWFDVHAAPTKTEGIFYFATHANPAVQAEAALKTFIQTLTKTFAHLPIGLAIFDRNRRLALFNPALADLTALEPDWLTARPALKAFLDRLRENRHVPEPKDYKSWRDRIAAVEKAAVDGSYEEHWPLPTGQTYRVTGRPHPEGAVAFLFEDITSNISLQRQFRAELELSQSVLDSLPGAICVFSSDGDVVMSNEGFTTIWGVDPREMLARYSIEDATHMWRKACDPHTVWAELVKFVHAQRDRNMLESVLRMKNGLVIRMQVTPLARGATFCGFTIEPQHAFRADPKRLTKA